MQSSPEKFGSETQASLQEKYFYDGLGFTKLDISVGCCLGLVRMNFGAQLLPNRGDYDY